MVVLVETGGLKGLGEAPCPLRLVAWAGMSSNRLAAPRISRRAAPRANARGVRRQVLQVGISFNMDCSLAGFFGASTQKLKQQRPAIECAAYEYLLLNSRFR